MPEHGKQIRQGRLRGWLGRRFFHHDGGGELQERGVVKDKPRREDDITYYRPDLGGVVRPSRTFPGHFVLVERTDDLKDRVTDDKGRLIRVTSCPIFDVER